MDSSSQLRVVTRCLESLTSIANHDHETRDPEKFIHDRANGSRDLGNRPSHLQGANAQAVVVVHDGRQASKDGSTGLVQAVSTPIKEKKRVGAAHLFNGRISR